MECGLLPLGLWQSRKSQWAGDGGCRSPHGSQEGKERMNGTVIPRCLSTAHTVIFCKSHHLLVVPQAEDQAINILAIDGHYYSTNKIGVWRCGTADLKVFCPWGGRANLISEGILMGKLCVSSADWRAKPWEEQSLKKGRVLGKGDEHVFSSDRSVWAPSSADHEQNKESLCLNLSVINGDRTSTNPI